MPIAGLLRRSVSAALIWGLSLVGVGCAPRHEQATAAAPAAPPAPPAPAATSLPALPPHAQPPEMAQGAEPSLSAESLVAQGKARFTSYKCYDCHGANGEGTNDGPNLTGTTLNGDQIAAFLQHPSPDARSAGMPTIPATSPDLKALAAYVVSLKRNSGMR